MIQSKSFQTLVVIMVLVFIGCQVFDDNVDKVINSSDPKRSASQSLQTEIGLETFIEETQKQLEKDNAVSPDERDPTLYLQKASDLMTALFYGDLELEDVVRVLQETGLEPYVVEQNGGGLNTVVSVRTRQNWPGTRYIEINYISDKHPDNGTTEMRLHNFKFEYLPGENSMPEVMQALDRSFVDLGIPEEERLGYRFWLVEKDYRLSIRRLSANDIELGHLYKAYSPRDIGTLSITLYRPMH